MNWKVGDVAVCIKVGYFNGDDTEGNPPPLRLNSEYIIQNMYKCPSCNTISFDVGLSSPCDENGNRGTICCTENIPCKEIHWCSENIFSKRKTKEEQLEEAIKEENYEKAGQLRDELK